MGRLMDQNKYNKKNSTQTNHWSYRQDFLKINLLYSVPTHNWHSRTPDMALFKQETIDNIAELEAKKAALIQIKQQTYHERIRLFQTDVRQFHHPMQLRFIKMYRNMNLHLFREAHSREFIRVCKTLDDIKANKHARLPEWKR